MANSFVFIAMINKDFDEFEDSTEPETVTAGDNSKLNIHLKFQREDEIRLRLINFVKNLIKNAK